MKKIFINFAIIATCLSFVGLQSCSNIPRRNTNLDIVKSEYPNAKIFSEKPDEYLSDWIILKDNQLYSVHVGSESRTIEATYLLSLRFDPNIQIDTIKTDTTNKLDTTIRVGTSKK